MILVVAEHANNKLSKSTYEMTQAARALGREASITLLVLGNNVAAIATEAAQIADQVLVADQPALAQYDAELWAYAVAQVATEGEAALVIIGGSRSGREYSPRVAVKLDAPLIEDAVSLKDSNGGIEAERYSFLARVTDRIRADAPIIVATIKPGSFTAATPHPTAAEQYDVDLTLPQRRLQITDHQSAKTDRVSLTEADIVVAGGRGVGSAEAFTQLVEGLADQLGAAVGATRAVVDAGWRPYSEQVGQTGKTVQPKMYWAIGISGAVQHLSGMGKSKLIIAINKDAEAPIFKIADYGIVGDVKEIVPAIIEKLRS
jgi:electron transfer flavoprotein alpha subunit